MDGMIQTLEDVAPAAPHDVCPEVFLREQDSSSKIGVSLSKKRPIYSGFPGRGCVSNEAYYLKI